MMNIDDLTIGQVKELTSMISPTQHEAGLNRMIGLKCIIRTYSAGVWFGRLTEKSGKEVILVQARRMWRWCAAESISLSAVAMFGIDQERSRIPNPVESIWLEAIEIIPCTPSAIESIEGAVYAKAE